MCLLFHSFAETNTKVNTFPFSHLVLYCFWSLLLLLAILLLACAAAAASAAIDLRKWIPLYPLYVLVRPKKLILRSGTILLAVGCWHIATYDAAAAAVAATITIELTYLQDAAQIEMGIESSEVNVRNVSKKMSEEEKAKI